jgi:hypothetical protein
METIPHSVVFRMPSRTRKFLVTNLSWKGAPIKKGCLKEVSMLFMVNSRPRAGATREQLIEHLTRRLDPSTWDLIRHGVLSHVLYKVGVEPGFFGVLNAPSIEEANKIIAAGVERLELFDLEVVPVNQFPHFA